jgi:hypothetical protein
MGQVQLSCVLPRLEVHPTRNKPEVSPSLNDGPGQFGVATDDGAGGSAAFARQLMRDA